MIPKIIHYIWLGGKPLPQIATKCIESWKKYCPDYQIKRWDESNLNLEDCQYAKQAYESKKFAFASDYFRFDILNKEGGIYLDIDVELLKPIDSFLNHRAFMGFETSEQIAPGLILGAEKGNKFISEILEIYKKKLFLKSDGSLDLTTICQITTEFLKTKGLKTNNTYQDLEHCVVYPSEYFCPINIATNRIKKTKNTYAIHHYNASWYSNCKKFCQKTKKLLNKISFGFFGKFIADIKGQKISEDNNKKAQVTAIVIKTSILFILMTLSLIFPLVTYIALFFCIIFAVTEKNADGTYYLFGLLPFRFMFRSKLVGFPFIPIVFASLCVFYFVKYYLIRKEKFKLNIPIIVSMVVFIFYLVLPINKGFFINDYANVCISLMVIYFAFMFKDKLNFKKMIIFFAIGLGCATLLSYFSQYLALKPFIELENLGGRVNNMKRFCGLTGDPNFYVLDIIIFMSSLMVLYFKNSISKVFFYCSMFFIAFFGWLTYSKSFIICYALLIAIYAVCLFIYKRQLLINAVCFILCAVVPLVLLVGVFKKNSLYVFDRFSQEYVIPDEKINNGSIDLPSPNEQQVPSPDTDSELYTHPQDNNMMNNITTGRFELWQRYLKVSFSSISNFLFGLGMGMYVYPMEAHNTYIQILYEIGLIGYLLIAAIFIIFVIQLMKHNKYKILSFTNLIPLMLLLILIMSYNYYGSTIFPYYILVCFYAFSYKNKVIKN